MRKMMMIALPCLLFSTVVMAKEAPSLDARHGADDVLMAAALEAGSLREQAPLRMDGMLEAAKRSKSAKAPAPAPAPAAATPTDTSKRFNMTQDGKKMTADDFDAWMKKNGYRVATGAPAKKAEEPAKKDAK